MTGMENTMIWDFVWRLVLAALFGTIIGSGPGVPGERGGFQNPFSRFAGECAHDDRFAVRLFGDFDA